MRLLILEWRLSGSTAFASQLRICCLEVAEAIVLAWIGRIVRIDDVVVSRLLAGWPIASGMVAGAGGCGGGWRPTAGQPSLLLSRWPRRLSATRHLRRPAKLGKSSFPSE